MNRDDYRTAMDSVELSEGFRQKTLLKLTQTVGQSCEDEKEIKIMKPRRSMKTVAIAAATAVILVISATAAVVLLSPKEVASHLEDPVLAAAFGSKGSVLIDQTAESEGYTFTLAGLVSGAGISEYAQDVDSTRTYAMVTMAHTDGTPLDSANLETNFTPLISGYAPWIVNSWTLGGGYSSFVQNGVAYYLFECESLEIFADHTVYLAAFQGLSPSAEFFLLNDDGSISFADGVQGPHAIFTLPLNPAKADPAAVDLLLKDLGLEP